MVIPDIDSKNESTTPKPNKRKGIDPETDKTIQKRTVITKPSLRESSFLSSLVKNQLKNPNRIRIDIPNPKTITRLSP